MLRLVLLRHGKSAYPDAVPDHERPLSPRGRRDAGAAGSWLLAQVGAPDLVIVSTARRAQQTWAAATTAVPELAEVEVRSEPQVYDASTGTLLGVVRGLPDAARTVLLVGHCPGVEELAHLLTGSADPVAADLLAQKYPTSAIAVLALPGPWQLAAPGIARLDHFVVPRAN